MPEPPGTRIRCAKCGKRRPLRIEVEDFRIEQLEAGVVNRWLRTMTTFTRDEVDSSYVDSDVARFVVSLIVGYHADELDIGEVFTDADTALRRAAVYEALERTRGPGSEDMQWRVYDRKTKTMHIVEQWKVDEDE